ncbi:MAG TPA: fumarylacetoacetate hydrolase family protein [Nocardioidaceae bacterium]|nr:fumarylacetoacetate hydrolase family protein [Nocardioidaceae bacterium]
MKICRYDDAGAPAWGVVEDDQVFALRGDPFGGHQRGILVGELASTRLLAPCAPSKVVCAGRNYRSLLEAQGREVPKEPFLFLKASTTVVGPNSPVYRPEGVSDFVYEGELGAVIGRRASGLTAEEAAGAILGYTCGNDMTVRDWQDPSAQWWRAKSSDTHCPLGPWIETDFEPAKARVQTLVNGAVRQDGTTDDLVFDVNQLVAYVSQHMTLLPGDVVLTGTPAGISPVDAGDVIEVRVDGIGSLVNEVVRWP